MEYEYKSAPNRMGLGSPSGANAPLVRRLSWPPASLVRARRLTPAAACMPGEAHYDVVGLEQGQASSRQPPATGCSALVSLSQWRPHAVQPIHPLAPRQARPGDRLIIADPAPPNEPVALLDGSLGWMVGWFLVPLKPLMQPLQLPRPAGSSTRPVASSSRVSNDRPQAKPGNTPDIEGAPSGSSAGCRVLGQWPQGCRPRWSATLRPRGDER